MKTKIISMTNQWIEKNSTPVINFWSREIAQTKKDNVVLIGMRRLGKTEYLKYRHSLNALNNNLDKMTEIFINFDDSIFSTTDFSKKESFAFQKISDGIEEIISENPIKLILIDEIQRRIEWTTWLKGLVDKYPQITFVCTGSDATAMMNSSEFGGGRFKILFIGQYTFKEYLEGSIGTPKKSFLDYVNYNFYPSRDLSNDYDMQYNQIIEKQLLTRNIKRRLVSAVLKYISLNPGLKLNPNRIASSISELYGVKVDARQVGITLKFLEESQLVFKIKNLPNSLRIKAKEEFRYYASNFNAYKFFVDKKLFEELDETLPRKGLIFENIILSNVYSSLNTFFKREQIGFSEFPKGDVDFSLYGKNIEIKSGDIFDEFNKSLKKAVVNKMSSILNPIVIHTGISKVENDITFINYEEFLKNELWKKW